jgi:hypothetical protein
MDITKKKKKGEFDEEDEEEWIKKIESLKRA